MRAALSFTAMIGFVALIGKTAIGGLLPLALQGQALYALLAWVIVGGLISSTLLARIVTPVLYHIWPPEVAVRRNNGTRERLSP